MSRYLVIIEPTPSGFSAYLPDVPGCVSAAETREDVEGSIREAIALHLAGLREDGAPIPPPTSVATYVEVAA